MNNYMYGGFAEYSGECNKDDKGYGYTSEWVPKIISESARGMEAIDLMARHLSDRVLFLSGEVDHAMSLDFVSKIKYLVKSNEPIDIYIDSPGGVVDCGLIIYDVIQSLEGKVPINIYCIGIAASMGAVILAGGHKGRRFVMPHGKVMIHEPLISGGVGGSATSIKKTSESILKTKSIINEILSKHTGKSTDEIDEATAFDNYMNAQEAVEFGICDEIKNIF